MDEFYELNCALLWDFEHCVTPGSMMGNCHVILTQMDEDKNKNKQNANKRESVRRTQGQDGRRRQREGRGPGEFVPIIVNTDMKKKF